jgi:hypothetical protein
MNAAESRQSVLTVGELLSLEEFLRAEVAVAAGGHRLGNRVEWVHVFETPFVADAIRGGEFLLTTGIALAGMRSAEVDELVARLARAGAAGIGFEPTHAPAATLVEPCRRHELPLLVFGRDVRFVEITHVVHERLVSSELATLRRAVGLQAQLREAAEALTQEEVRSAQVRDRESAHAAGRADVIERLGLPVDTPPERLSEEDRAEQSARLERLERRRERLGPVNPLAKDEYAEALAHVEELEGQRKDLEAALAELQGLIRETDRLIRESFTQTFETAAKNFEDVIERLFPGGRGRLRRVSASRAPAAVLGGEQDEPGAADPGFGQRPAGEPVERELEGTDTAEVADHDTLGIEIEVTPAGKTTRRLSLLSGGEKSLVALAFMFAVFLARPCPFYILDEVEAALDDANIDRFLSLVRAYCDRAQFIIVTHQRRTMEAADVLYGVSMGKDGVSKVVSRRLESVPGPEAQSQAA